jgi:hypothetical protein
MGRAAARREASSRTGRGKPALLTHGQALHAPGIEFVEFVAAFCRICEQNETYDFINIVKLDSVHLLLKKHVSFSSLNEVYFIFELHQENPSSWRSLQPYKEKIPILNNHEVPYLFPFFWRRGGKGVMLASQASRTKTYFSYIL